MKDRTEEYRIYDQKRSEKRKREYILNRDSILQYHRNYYKENKDKVKLYYLKNKKKINQRQREYMKTYDKKYINTLKYLNRKMTELGDVFNMNKNEYDWALQSWSKTIKKLDNNICKNCGSKTDLHAHHIQPKSLFPELSLDLNNGITLCKECHYEIHGYMYLCVRDMVENR